MGEANLKEQITFQMGLNVQNELRNLDFNFNKISTIDSVCLMFMECIPGRVSKTSEETFLTSLARNKRNYSSIQLLNKSME